MHQREADSFGCIFQAMNLRKKYDNEGKSMRFLGWQAESPPHPRYRMIAFGGKQILDIILSTLCSIFVLEPLKGADNLPDNQKTLSIPNKYFGN